MQELVKFEIQAIALSGELPWSRRRRISTAAVGAV